jgi:hypothetical protein
MERFQKTERIGSTVNIRRGDRHEVHEFGTEQEAISRVEIITEAFSWIGTPFVDCACVKGRGGAVDCAMLLRECYVKTGRLEDFDPRPYPPRWHVHKDEERFLDWLIRLGAKETSTPKLADIVVWKFGRTYSHGAILVNSQEVVHAYYAAGMTMMNRLDEPVLGVQVNNKPRPVKFFDVWSR